MTEIPWIALSPNPLTLTVWVLLAVYGAKQLLKRNEYRRWRRLNAFTDSLFILGFVVLSMDLMWVLVCGFRFSWFYPLESGLQLFGCAGRNMVGMIFCYLLIGGYFKNGTVKFGWNTAIAYAANLAFLAVWFGLSPGPWLTDWTYAIRHGHPQATVLTSFFISHVVGKTLLAVVFVTIWRKPTKIPKQLRTIYRTFKKTTHTPKSRDELYQYWKNPWDGSNLPQAYLHGEARSQFLVKMLKRHTEPNAKILEIGCNVGRNLNHLFLAGFKELSGVEISEKAVELLNEAYPKMASHTKIYVSPIEEIIREFRDGEFDVVFTMAVLQHIHTESEWIFPEITRITKNFLVTIEDEQAISWRHFPRNYKKVFEPLGLKQVEELNCSKVDGLDSGFFARIFKPRTNSC